MSSLDDMRVNASGERRRVDIRTQIHRRRVNRAATSETIDVDTLADESSCIDLTKESPVIRRGELVDLTSANDSPIVIMSSTSDGNRTRLELSSDSDTEEAGISAPVFDLTDSRLGQVFIGAEEEGGARNMSLDNSLLMSPGQSICCPICLDSLKKIQQQKRRLASTVCGHIFCEKCIHEAITATHKCPTCRKKLTLKQMHPLFL